MEIHSIHLFKNIYWVLAVCLTLMLGQGTIENKVSTLAEFTFSSSSGSISHSVVSDSEIT